MHKLIYKFVIDIESLVTVYLLVTNRSSINTLRFYLCVCLSVRDGCGRGRNEFAGHVQKHHVRSSCHRNGYNLSRARDSKTCCWSGHSVSGYAKDALWTLAIALSDRQEHKIIWRAGPERERIFHLCVTACREQGSHCHHERLAWVALQYGGRGLRAPAHSSRKSWERTTTELTTFILWLTKFAVCTDRK